MTALLNEILSHALMITGFVFMMMVVIEYLNVLTEEVWQQGFRGSRLRQYLLAAFLGVTPGCLGAFVVVALYSHRVISLGAVVAAMIATSGDEAFVMFSLVPATAFRISLVLFLVGICSGYLTDTFLMTKETGPPLCDREFQYHEADSCNCFPHGQIKEQWAHCTMSRGVLTVVLVLFVFGMFTGQLGPTEWNWIKISILVVSGIALFIVATVPDHFLEEHLWEHVAKVHAPRIFLWILGALFFMHLLVDHLHLSDWMEHNQLIMLAIAALTGLIPESGPHLIFLTLFTEGAIPFSILLASSIVQDGHGMLPLLAESRWDFLKVKAINLLVGLLAGLIGYAAGW